MDLLTAGAVAKGWLATLGMVAAQGTVLALLALAITRAGRMRPAWQAAIWLVVAAKLALPWGPAMPYSLSDLVAMLSASPDVAPLAPIVVTDNLVRVAPAVPSIWPSISWLALAALWTLGAAFVVTRAVRAHVRTSRAVRTAEPAPGDAQRLVEMLAAAMGVRTPRLVVGGDATGPHVVGFFRHVVVVPRALLADATRSDDHALLRAALLHELAHVRRRDSLGRLIQIAAHAMMWWLPFVVRVVNRKLELARESACDAYALELGNVPRHAYARLLVRMSQLRGSLAAPMLDAASPALAAQHAHALDARVAAVLGPPARARMTHLHRLVIAGWAVLALGGARTASAKSKLEVCQYTPQMAEALIVAFPEADLDGDGQLSRDEACDLQAELRLIPEEERMTRLTPEAEAATLLAEPLCCNCTTTTVEPTAIPETISCQKSEGVD